MTDTTSSWLDIGERITNWADLASLVEKYSANEWIFRGADDARHPLLSGIGRPGTRKTLDSGISLPFDESVELKMLRRFEREVRPHAVTQRHTDLQHDLELRALAQHHGLKTRLMDWSRSPFVAAFFAVDPAGIVDGSRADAALYGTPCPLVIESGQKWPSGHDVVSYEPPHLTPRITVQQALFTVHSQPDIPWKPESLRRWVIPSEACLHIKLALNRAGINRASLFPDRDGIAAHLNWLYKWGLQ